MRAGNITVDCDFGPILYAAAERSFVKQHGDSRGASSQSCGIGLSVLEDLAIAAPRVVAGLQEGAHAVRGTGKEKAYGGFDKWAFGLPEGALIRLPRTSTSIRSSSTRLRTSL